MRAEVKAGQLDEFVRKQVANTRAVNHTLLELPVELARWSPLNNWDPVAKQTMQANRSLSESQRLKVKGRPRCLYFVFTVARFGGNFISRFRLDNKCALAAQWSLAPPPGRRENWPSRWLSG